MSKVKPANQNPCKDCPWRTSNQGKSHPGHWYTKANLSRLWARLRRGESMSCHPTDPSNPLPPGFEPLPDGVETHECTGGLIVQQREMMAFQCECRSDLKTYRAQRSSGMTREGLLSLVERAMFGGTCFGGTAMSKPDLNEPDVQHPRLPWPPRESVPEAERRRIAKRLGLKKAARGEVRATETLFG